MDFIESLCSIRDASKRAGNTPVYTAVMAVVPIRFELKALYEAASWDASVTTDQTVTALTGYATRRLQQRAEDADDPTVEALAVYAIAKLEDSIELVLRNVVTDVADDEEDE